MGQRAMGIAALALSLALGAACPALAVGARHFKSGPIQVTADGAWIWTVNPDDDSVSRIEAATDDVTRWSLAGCRLPEGLALREDGSEILVACRESDRLVVLDGLGADAGTVLAVLDLPRGSGPFGIALAPDQQRAIVTLSRQHALAVIDVPGRRVTDILDRLESTPLGVAFTSDGQSAWITHLRRFADMTFLARVDMTGARPVVATSIPILPAAPLRSGSLNDPDPARNVAEGGYLTFRGHLAQLPPVTGRREMWIPTQYTNVHETVYPTPADSTAQSSVRHLLLDAKTLPETLTNKVILSAAQVHQPSGAAWAGPGWDAHVAGPVDIGFTADGLTACVLHEVSGDLVVMPVSTPAFKPSAATPPLPEIAVGARPQGLAISPVASIAYVMNRLGDPSGAIPGRTVSVVDLAGLRELRQISVAPESLPPGLLLGARIFHSSNDPRISVKQKVGCATCHPGGEEDSSQWDMQATPGAHGPRMVPSLLGLSLTFTNGERDAVNGYGLLHHSGDRDEIQDFDFTFSGVQLGGTGFLGGSANAELGPPNAGISPELDALADYVLSLPPLMKSPHRAPSGELTEAALRGATFFAGADPRKPADAACASCHDPRRGFVDRLFHDVGQLRGGGENELNNRTPPWEIKTPTLIGVWATTPFEGTQNVHAQSRDLMEFLLDVRGPIGHGRVDGLTGRQLRDLHDFVLSIDGEMTADEVLLARDTVPPRLERVEPVSLSLVTAWFNESVDPATAADPGNWTVRDVSGNDVPVTAAIVDPLNGDVVRLSVSLSRGCPATYTVIAGAIRDLADRATDGIANVVDASDPRNSRQFTIGDTLTVTLGSSGAEHLTIPVHDAGTFAATWSYEFPRLVGPGATMPPVPRRGFVRFDWAAAFAAATGLASSADIVDASFSLRADSGDAHGVALRRVLQPWQDNTVRGSAPPAGSLTYMHHSTPSDAWNLPGAAMMTAGVDGDDPADYGGDNDVGATIDEIVAVRSVKERTNFGGTGVTSAYRFWFDHPTLDHGHALELAAGSVRELEFGRIGAGLLDARPTLTITYRVPGAVVVPPEVSPPGQLPLLVTRVDPAGDTLRLSFEDVGARAASYGLYAGNIGAWYAHASAACDVNPAAAGGRRETLLAVPESARYFLATALTPCAEGPSGADSRGVAHPFANLDCSP